VKDGQAIRLHLPDRHGVIGLSVDGDQLIYLVFLGCQEDREQQHEGEEKFHGSINVVSALFIQSERASYVLFDSPARFALFHGVRSSSAKISSIRAFSAVAHVSYLRIPGSSPEP
jgi:hypothetical protein